MSKRSKLPNALDVSYTVKVQKVFEQQGWETENELGELFFDRFCRMLVAFSNEEKDLLLDLTKRYLWINTALYTKELINVLTIFAKALEVKKKNYKRYYIMPVNSDTGEGNRSGSFMAYFMSGTEIKTMNPLAGNKVAVADKLIALPRNIKRSVESILVVVDDYVGTGETAKTFLRNLFNNDTRVITPDKVVFLSLVAQEIGYNRIKELGVRHYTSHLRKRGITDHYSPEQLSSIVKLMQSIESKIDVDEKFNFGYGKSEALVTVHKTPNNTFPVYWFKGKNNNVAPFL